MLKNIIVKIAIVVISLLIMKPVAAGESKTIKDDKIIINPFCHLLFVCQPPIDPVEKVVSEIRR